jgi:hypothetical protein
MILLLGLALLLSGYALLRYAGWWGEGDTAAFTKFIAKMLETGDLIPAGAVYRNGYGYPVLITWLVTFTGLSLDIVQLIGGALLVVWVVVPAWLAYREFTQSELAASLASLILLIQPEFLFPLLRGTHEKFTRGFMFIALYLLLRGMRSRSTRHTSLLVVCFYLSAYGLISVNTFMATSFILAIILALGLAWLVNRLAPKNMQTGKPVISKLIYVVISLLVVAFLFTFYAYTPAEYQLQILHYFIDRLALLFLNTETTAGNPYQVVNTGWVSQPVYYLVSLANWLLLGISFVLWLRQAYVWLIKRSFHPENQEILLWAFYTSFAFMGVSSILLDVSGALSSNMQVRVYSSFAMIAAPLVGAWLAKQKFSQSVIQKLIWAGTSLAFGCLMVLSAFKATNEPLLSNYWLFYTPAERQSLIWAEQNLNQRTLWTGQTGRVSDGYTIRENGRQVDIGLTAWIPDPTTQNYLISDVIRLYAQRTGTQLPVQPDSLLTYDNGTAQIYHRRPVTPYQK